MSWESKTGRVTASLLNMRKSPGGPVLKVLPRNTKVEILGRTGNWLNIREADLLGFVSSKYIRIELEEKEAPVKQAGTVNASMLNLRIQPGGSIIDVLPNGTAVTVLETKENWLKVKAGGHLGYVSKQYITIDTRVTLPTAEKQKDIEGFRFDGKTALAPDGTTFAKKFRKGVFNYGKTSIGQFIDNNRNRFPDTSDSLLKIMMAVSENEGKFEAINTWDNAFLSFGIFQWTSGPGSEAGELPALLQLLRNRYPDTLEEYFGKYGLTITGIRSPIGVAPRGYFNLRGVLLRDIVGKSSLRSLPWAYRFWLAGQDDNVREVQTLHAMKRIDLFYHLDNRKIGKFYVSDYVTSEYGVALMLDQHVNRPGHVPRIMGNAVKELNSELQIDDPQNWGDEEENRLIEKYLELRAKTSMTDSTHRAERILEKVESNLISKNRHSFKKEMV